ncbi:type I secretion system protein LssZ [Legionella sp. D16C41]|uniref:type I secretion system protein LssZ n=1 Tax=Legionella sp. D16C41 TaxID=3402688 RepID=UPI003AF8D8D0
MSYFRDLMHIILPLLSLLLLVLGVKNRRKSYIVLAVWISIISLVIHYEIAGGEILGSYFNYLRAFIYSLNLLIILACIIFLTLNFRSEIASFRYFNSLLGAISVIGIGFLLINLWMNAWFIENRLPGTPIFQVGTFQKLNYCSYRYIFYKISQDGSVKFMCPNHYGLIPSIGGLNTAPDFILKQLPPALQKKFQSTQIKQLNQNAMA